MEPAGSVSAVLWPDPDGGAGLSLPDRDRRPAADRHPSSGDRKLSAQNETELHHGHPPAVDAAKRGKLDPDPPIERLFVGAVRSCDDPPLPAAAVERLAVWGAAGGDGSDPYRLFLRASQKGHLT